GHAQAGAAVLLGHGDAQPAVVGQGRVEVVRETAVAVALQPVVVRKTLAYAADGIAQGELVGREFKIHQRAPSWVARAAISASISASVQPASRSISRLCSPSRGAGRRIAVGVPS